MKKVVSLLLIAISSKGMADIRVYAPPAIPADAFSAGIDTDGKKLYACAANFRGSIQPGKTWAGYNKCNIAYAGAEYAIPSYSIVRGQYRWAGRSLVGALPVGRDTNGNVLYFCLAPYQGSWQPGKTWTGYNKCNISWGGREIIVNRYTVLGAMNRHAHAHGAPAIDRNKHTRSSREHWHGPKSTVEVESNTNVHHR